MDNIILSPIQKDIFITEILNGVKSLLDQNREKSLNDKKNWTAKETAQYCKVTKPTIHEWTKKGILKKYKIGSRVFYKSNEVIKAIHEIESK